MNDVPRLHQSERQLRRRLAAIAFLDVVGYSRLMAVSEETTLRAWRDLRHIVIEPRVIAWRGRVIDRVGDGIFAEFGSALEALNWAVDVQNAASQYADDADAIKLRIALHLADVIDGPDGEVQGDGVNTAARLQTYADAGGVIISQTVLDAVRGKTDADFIDVGLLRLRNIAYPVHAFRLVSAPGGALSRSGWRRRACLGVAVVLGALLLALFQWYQPVYEQAGGALQRGLAALNWHTPVRVKAERLLQQGLAIKCPSFPCAREWLEKRSLFQEAVTADPTFARPYAEAALTYTNFVAASLSTDIKADLRTAASLATQAVALAPDQAFSHYARAAVLRQDPDRLEEALSAYLRVLYIEPSNTVARANAGWVLLLLGRPSESETYEQAALDFDPENPLRAAWLNRMGLAELFLDHNDRAVVFFRRAITAQSAADANTDAGQEREINLAAALALAGDLDTARSVVAQLRQRYPWLSVNNIWNCICSREPRFQAGMEKLRRGAALAGLVAD